MGFIPDDILDAYTKPPRPPAQPKVEGDESVARVVDDELTKLGYPSTARLSILGDVGRENGWNRSVIFKGHADPKNNAYNRGIISWQGDRQTALEKALKKEGVFGRGDDEELRGMVRFMDQELQSPEYRSVRNKLLNPKSTREASEALRQYIKYVPTAPYNTPDPEFVTANNAKWAKTARRLGLGTVPAFRSADDVFAAYGESASEDASPEQPASFDDIADLYAQPDDKPTVPPTPTVLGQQPLVPPVNAPDVDVKGLQQQLAQLPPDSPEAKAILDKIARGNAPLPSDPNEMPSAPIQDEPIQLPDIAELEKLGEAIKQGVEYGAPQNDVAPRIPRPVAQQPVTRNKRYVAEEPVISEVDEPTTNLTQANVTREGLDDAVALTIPYPESGNPEQYVIQELKRRFPEGDFSKFERLNRNEGATGAVVTYGDLKSAGIDLTGEEVARQRTETPTPDLSLRGAPIFSESSESEADLREKFRKEELAKYTDPTTLDFWLYNLTSSPFTRTADVFSPPTKESIEKTVDERIAGMPSAGEGRRATETYNPENDFPLATVPARLGGAAYKGFVVDNFAPFLETGGIAQSAFKRYVLGDKTAQAKDTDLFKSGQVMRQTHEQGLPKGTGGIDEKFARGLGQAAGTIMLMAATGGLGGAARTGATKTATSALDEIAIGASGIADNIAKSTLKTAAGKMLNPQMLRGAVVGVAQQASQAYEMAKRKGATEDQAMLASLLSAPGGFVEGLSESTLVQKLTRIQKLDAISDGLFSKGLMGKAKEIAKTGNSVGVSDLWEEMLQGVNSEAAKTVYESRDFKTFSQDVDKSVRDALLAYPIGFVIGGAGAIGQQIGTREPDAKGSPQDDVSVRTLNEAKIPEPSPSLDEEAVVSAEKPKKVKKKEIPQADVESRVSDDVSGDTEVEPMIELSDYDRERAERIDTGDERRYIYQPQDIKDRFIRDNKALKNNPQTVVLYRSTIGKGLNPGDFVYLDKREALKHQSELGEEGARIISREVPIGDLVMGQDTTEFIYSPAKPQPPAKDAGTQETKAPSPKKVETVSPIRSRTRELGLIRPKESKEIAPPKVESSASSDVSGEVKRNVIAGARVQTTDGKARVEDARKQLEAAINNPDLVGKQRADTIRNLKSLVQFQQAHAARSLETDYFKGDVIALTGGDAPEGFESFIYLEGSNAGSEGVRLTSEAQDKTAQRQQKEYQDQQAEFRKLRANNNESSKDISTATTPTKTDGVRTENVAEGRSGGTGNRRRDSASTPIDAQTERKGETTRVAKDATTQETGRAISPKPSRSPALEARKQRAADRKAERATKGVGKYPRLSENAADLFKSIQSLSDEGVVEEGRVLYPVVDTLGGGKYRVRTDNIERILDRGKGTRPATESEIADLHEAIDRDAVRVTLQKNWGGGQEREGATIRELHSPRGNSFKTEAPTVEKDATTQDDSRRISGKEQTVDNGRESASVRGGGRNDATSPNLRSGEGASNSPSHRGGVSVETSAGNKDTARSGSGDTKEDRGGGAESGTTPRNTPKKTEAQEASVKETPEIAKAEAKDDSRGLTQTQIATELNRFTKSGDLAKYRRQFVKLSREDKIRVAENLRAGDDPVTAIKDAKGFSENLGEPDGPRKSKAPRSRVLAEPDSPLSEHDDDLGKEEDHARTLAEVRFPTFDEALPGYENAKVSHPEVMKTYQGVLKSLGRPTPIRYGRIAEKARGIYKPHSEVIRLREAGNIPTAAHEIFHAIQKVMFGGVQAGALKPIPRPALRELVQLGRELYGDIRPSGGYRTEGFAEFGRLYLTHDNVKEKAPNMYRYFTEEYLPSNPDLAKGLEKAREVTDTYRQQGAVNRAQANIARPTTRSRAKQAVARFRSQLPTLLVDEFAPLLNFTKQVEKLSGEKLSPAENPGMVASFLRGGAASVVHYMATENMIDAARNKVSGPLIDAAAIVRGQEREFEAYLWGRRALERWRQDKNPGMSREDAAALVRTLDSDTFRLAAQKVYDWNNGILNYVKTMVPDLAESIDAIQQGSYDYVPLMREMNDAQEEALAGRYSGVGQNALFKMKGSGRRIKPLFPQMLANAERMISLAHKRKVVDTIIRLEDLEGVGSLIERVPRDKVPQSVSIADIEQALEKAGADLKDVDLDTVVTFFTPAKFPKGQDPIIPAMRDGKMVWFQVPADLYNTLSGLDLYRLPKVLDLLFGAPTRLFRLGTTGLRASFSLLTNPLRDIQTAFLQTQAKNPAKLAANYVATMVHALNPKRVVKGMPEDLDAFHRLGIAMAQPLGMDEAITNRYADKLFQGPIKRRLTSPINTLRDLFSLPESFPRVAELRSLGEEIGWKPGDTLSFDQAVQLGLAGKQVTVDFSAAGKIGKIFNQSVPFFNANVQGTRSFARAFKRSPVGATLKGLTAFMLPTLLLWWQNKDEEWYKDMPEREKAMYWSIKIPGSDEIIQIPRAQEWGGLFATIPESIFNSWYQQDSEGFMASVGYLFDLATPPVEPVLLRVAHEQWANEIEFFDRPIVPKGEEGLPPSEQVGPYTSGVAKFLGKQLPDAEILGIPINSPRRIDAVIRSIGGGVAADLAQLTGPTREGERTWSDAPVIGRLFRRGGDVGYGSKTIDAFYKALTKARQRGMSASEETEEEKRLRKQLEDANLAMQTLRKNAKGAGPKLQREMAIMIKDIATRAATGQIPYEPNPGRDAEKIAASEQKEAAKRLSRYFPEQDLVAMPPDPIKDTVAELLALPKEQRDKATEKRIKELVDAGQIKATDAPKIRSAVVMEKSPRFMQLDEVDGQEFVRMLDAAMKSADDKERRKLIMRTRQKWAAATSAEKKALYKAALDRYRQ